MQNTRLRFSVRNFIFSGFPQQIITRKCSIDCNKELVEIDGFSPYLRSHIVNHVAGFFSHRPCLYRHGGYMSGPRLMTALGALIFSLSPGGYLIAQTTDIDVQTMLPKFVRLDQQALEAAAINRKNPILPPLSTNLNIGTEATVELIVDENGLVRHARVLSADSRLQKEALRASREWRFSLPRGGRGPVFAIGAVTLSFAESPLSGKSAEIAGAMAAAEQDPKNADLYYRLASLYEEAGLQDKAIDSLKRALALKPDHETACILLGEIYGRLQRPKDQIATYDGFLLWTPESAAVTNSLGQAYMGLKMYEKQSRPLKHW